MHIQHISVSSSPLSLWIFVFYRLLEEKWVLIFTYLFECCKVRGLRKQSITNWEENRTQNLIIRCPFIVEIGSAYVFAGHGYCINSFSTSISNRNRSSLLLPLNNQISTIIPRSNLSSSNLLLFFGQKLTVFWRPFPVEIESIVAETVSYTHLTLPTIYSV